MWKEGRVTKTCKRLNAVHHAHALTFSCYCNRAFFKRLYLCDWLVDALRQSRRKHQYSLWGYVIMPNHVHLLIRPETPDYSISTILQSLKQPVSVKAIRWLKEKNSDGLKLLATEQKDRPYRFWQKGGGFDQNITDFDALKEVLGYIHMNPVRKELAKNPLDWYYSSAAVWAGVGQKPLSVDRQTWPF